MRTSNSMAILAGVAVAVLLVAAHAQAIVAYNCPADMAGTDNAGQPYMIGNVFTVNSAINVTAVGAFENGPNGGSLGVTVPVAIYSTSDNGANWSQVNGTSESFSGTTGAAIGNARFQPVTLPVVTLIPGTYAIVAANYGVPGSLFWNNSGGVAPTFQTESSAIMMGNSSQSYNVFYYSPNIVGISTLQPSFSGSGLTEFSSGPAPNYLGGTFEFEPVPEAATFGAAGVGLLGLVYIGRYARLRSKVTPA